VAKPFPTFSLSRTPTPSSWKEEVLVDPTIRSVFESGAVLSRARFSSLLYRVSFTYNWLTQADKDLIVDFEQHVKVGASTFDFRNPITNEDWEMRLLVPIKYAVEPQYPERYSATIEMFGKEISKMRQDLIWVEWTEGSDVDTRPIFASPKAITFNSIGILTQGDATITGSDTITLTLKDDAGNTIVSKEYTSSSLPAGYDYSDLGTLSNESMLAGEHATLSLTHSGSPIMPAFYVVLEFYYT